MVHETVFEQYPGEILGVELKQEVIDESKDKKRRDKIKMYQLVGLRSARREPVSTSAQPSPAMAVSMATKKSVRMEGPGDGLEKLGSLLRKSSRKGCVSPKVHRMEGMDRPMGPEQKKSRRAGKRDAISVQFISRLCRCFMTGTSLAETKRRRRDIKSTITPDDSEDCCRSLRSKRTQVETINLFCHRGREEKAKVDQRRAAEANERIQHQRKKLINLHPQVHKSNYNFSKSGEERPRVAATDLKNVCDILHHQEFPVSGSRSRSSSCSDEYGKKTALRSKFPTSSSSIVPGPKNNEKCGSKVETKVTPIRRSSEDPPLNGTKRNSFSATQSNGVKTNDDLAVTVTAATSKEVPHVIAVAQLRLSTSPKDYFEIEVERKDEIESHVQQTEEVLDVFYEIEGESPRHRKLRYEGFKNSQSCKRAARKIEAIHKQEEARQRERDEITKAAYELDPQIQRWSSGKEEDLRALLSTLHHVLWPDCKWKSIHPSELVTPSAVKKVYRRASFCLHPDKVQQNGGTLEQKYVAEKVFGVLRQAWNKFYVEELV